MDSATWKGCVITDEEIVDFARRNYMELVALSGEGTQYLWVTLKKPAAHSPGPTLEAVTAAHDGESIVPQRGRHSGLSLWVRNASEGSDLTSLTAKINGARVRGCYLSPIGSNGGCQMNVMLPQDVSPGMAEVALLDRGVVSGTPKTIYIEAVHLVPRVTAIYDAVNTTLLMQSDSGGLKVLMEDLTAQETIRFRLADHPITGVDLVCTNRILGQFLFSLLLPPSISGAVKLSVLIEDHEVFGGTVEISTPQVAAENAAAETQEPKVIDPDAPRNQPSS